MCARKGIYQMPPLASGGKKNIEERQVKKIPRHPTTYPEGETRWGVQHVVAAESGG